MISGTFELHADCDDIVTLSTTEDERQAAFGWVNIGHHAVKLILCANGNLQIESYALAAESQILGSVFVPAAAAVHAYREAEGAALESPLAPLVEELREIGFGTDDDINGGDAVDTINRHFGQLCAVAKFHE